GVEEGAAPLVGPAQGTDRLRVVGRPIADRPAVRPAQAPGAEADFRGEHSRPLQSPVAHQKCPSSCGASTALPYRYAPFLLPYQITSRHHSSHDRYSWLVRSMG